MNSTGIKSCKCNKRLLQAGEGPEETRADEIGRMKLVSAPDKEIRIVSQVKAYIYDVDVEVQVG